MKKRYIIVAVCLIVPVAMGWVLWPGFVVAQLNFVEKKGEEPSRRVCNRIVAVGPRVIPAVIDSIKENSPWVRRHCYLPIALRELGQPAHEALLEAIDSESDELTRAKLISSLQSAFEDYSRLVIVIDDAKAGRIQGHPIYMMSGSIQATFTNAPPFKTDDSFNVTVNPDFIEWWRQNSEQQNSGD